MPEKMIGVNAGGGTRGAEPCFDPAAAVLIYATFPSLAVAERIGGELVGCRLAACVNVIPGMQSIYRWQGTVQRDDEVAAFVKTRLALAARVVGWVRIAHPYTNPALVTLHAIGGSADFLSWIASETGDDAGCV